MTGVFAWAFFLTIKGDLGVQKSKKAVQLNRDSEYAIRALAALARQSGTGAGACRLEALCAAEGLPKSFTAKLLARLARRGIVRATRGVRGGYRLAAPPARTRLWDVVVAMEGPGAGAGCLFWRKACSESDCPFRACYAGTLRKQALALLTGTTLADLLAGDMPGRAPAKGKRFSGPPPAAGRARAR